jgi:hypothetical protein
MEKKMSVKWLEIYKEVEGCKDWSEVEKLMVKNGVEKGEVFRMVKSSVSNYCYGRNYRSERNSSMKELRNEVKRLRGLVKVGDK